MVDWAILRRASQGEDDHSSGNPGTLQPFLFGLPHSGLSTLSYAWCGLWVSKFPRTIVVNGIAAEEPGSFPESLSAEFVAKLPQIVGLWQRRSYQRASASTPRGRRRIPSTSRGKKAWFQTPARPIELHEGEQWKH